MIQRGRKVTVVSNDEPERKHQGWCAPRALTREAGERKVDGGCLVRRAPAQPVFVLGANMITSHLMVPVGIH